MHSMLLTLMSVLNLAGFKKFSNKFTQIAGVVLFGAAPFFCILVPKIKHLNHEEICSSTFW